MPRPGPTQAPKITFPLPRIRRDRMEVTLEADRDPSHTPREREVRSLPDLRGPRASHVARRNETSAPSPPIHLKGAGWSTRVDVQPAAKSPRGAAPTRMAAPALATMAAAQETRQEDQEVRKTIPADDVELLYHLQI